VRDYPVSSGNCKKKGGATRQKASFWRVDVPSAVMARLVV
jgi:hypothetical protein